MKCKWYEQVENYSGEGSCDNPLEKLTRPERLRTGKIYKEAKNPVLCQRCVPKDSIAIVMVLLIVCIPLYAITKIK